VPDQPVEPQTGRNLRRRHCRLQRVNGARRGRHARQAKAVSRHCGWTDRGGPRCIFNTAGDSVVADFASAVDAVQCAVAVQAAIATENAGGVADQPMQFRIGVHVGDVMVDGDNLLGDGVNIAARLESLAEPGTIPSLARSGSNR